MGCWHELILWMNLTHCHIDRKRFLPKHSYKCSRCFNMLTKIISNDTMPNYCGYCGTFVILPIRFSLFFFLIFFSFIYCAYLYIIIWFCTKTSFYVYSINAIISCFQMWRISFLRWMEYSAYTGELLQFYVLVNNNEQHMNNITFHFFF